MGSALGMDLSAGLVEAAEDFFVKVYRLPSKTLHACFFAVFPVLSRPLGLSSFLVLWSWFRVFSGFYRAEMLNRFSLFPPS